MLVVIQVSTIDSGTWVHSMSKGKRRFWLAEEKRGICQQAGTAGISVAQVARRYAVHANLIHNWLKDPRFVPDAGLVEDIVDAAAFFPVETGAAAGSEGAILKTTPAAPNSPVPANRVDITLSDGRRISIEGPTALASVAGLVQGLLV